MYRSPERVTRLPFVVYAVKRPSTTKVPKVHLGKQKARTKPGLPEKKQITG